MRPELRVYADAHGRELFDLPDAPLPDSDAPAPVRLLPPFDAPILAHADRTRVMTDDVRRRVIDGAAVEAVVLVAGTVAGTWRSTVSDDGVVTLTVQPLRGLAAADRDDVEADSTRLLAFTDPDAVERRVAFAPPEL